MTNTELGLFRHGQTDWNINFLLQGVTDIPMNSFGIEQVQLAANVLIEESWDALIASPLTRTLQSAEIISRKMRNTPIVTTPLLIERSFGDAEGMEYSQWKQKYQEIHLIPGAESNESLRQRCVDFLEGILEEFSGKRILAVSHGALIRELIAIASEGELPREGERLSNASLNKLLHKPSGWVISSYSLSPLTPPAR